MPSTNKTPHGLNQWLPGDKPVMEDFNADNAALENEVFWKDEPIDWVTGTFTNPNPTKYTTYDLSYRYNKTLGLLYITGQIATASGTQLANNEVIANLSDIAGIAIPMTIFYIFGGAIWFAGASSGAIPCQIAIQTNGNIATAATPSGAPNNLRISTMVTTYGW